MTIEEKTIKAAEAHALKLIKGKYSDITSTRAKFEFLAIVADFQQGANWAFNVSFRWREMKLEPPTPADHSKIWVWDGKHVRPETRRIDSKGAVEIVEAVWKYWRPFNKEDL